MIRSQRKNDITRFQKTLQNQESYHRAWIAGMLRLQFVMLIDILSLLRALPFPVRTAQCGDSKYALPGRRY